MNAEGNDTQEEYMATCACRKCNNTATYCLRLAFLNREGDFCDTCSRELVAEGLVIFIGAINLGIGQGKVVELSPKQEAEKN